MRLGICATLLLAVSLSWGQAVQQQDQVNRSSRASVPAKAQPTKEHLKIGRQMLEMAEASANGMDGGMRAYGLLEVAKAYSLTDKKKALTLLDEALQATHVLDNDQSQWHTRNQLQEQILQAIVPLEPSKADELLDQVDPSARGRVLTALLGYYQKEKDWNRAISMIYRMAPEGAIPYEAVGEIMSNLPPDRSGDAVQLFVTALSSFKDHPPASGQMSFGLSDFPSLILSNWKSLPRETVLDAIEAVLTQAKEQEQQQNSGQNQQQPTTVSMSSPSGAVQFGSIYEYRLFQLLPVLKQLDPSKAADLVKQSQAVSAALQKYPEGVNSVAPTHDANGKRNYGPTSFTIGGPGNGKPGPGAGMRSPFMMQQVSRIVQDAAKHPDDALANAATIPDADLRVSAYMGIAGVCLKQHASVAQQALKKIMDGLDDIDLTRQVMLVGNVAKLYLEMNDTDSAKTAIEKGMSVAEKAYKQDTNSDDPNTALKAYWPSANAYQGLLRQAAKISPAWSIELLKDIGDPDMKGLGEITLAQTWLDVPPGSTTVMVNTKSGKNMEMMSAPGPQ